ncbi:MAG: molybdopterin molybdotransferase MoeA [Candidatus Omnitrophota bacterium]|nr:molybdopterin molybdotransferase MoeA [Candidatus Omnitrophota bacterium]MDZ4243326.1 molybdopterin molybdotransferase MoeA [Candidatus Omnitrophota bacterium]
MILPAQADKLIARHLRDFPVERVALTDASGLVLREDIFADRDLPAFDKSTMDGIAVCLASWEHGTRKFVLEGVQPAGQKAPRLKRNDGCFEIMTGAMLPEGCDCVVPIERVRIENGHAVIASDAALSRGQFMVRQAADHKKGERLLAKGIRMLPPHTAVAASVGKSRVLVTRKIKVAVIATGNELVNIARQKIAPHQIRLSNSYALLSLLKRAGIFESELFHIKDDPKALRSRLNKILKGFDVLVLSGGVSMGKFDYVPSVLKDLGVRVAFHKIAQRPGKPFWFGTSRKRQPVFALPGNPVSTLVCAYRYVVPHLLRAAGVKVLHPDSAALAKTLRVAPPLVKFLPVKFDPRTQGAVRAVGYSGSGDYVSLAQADGFVELLPGRTYRQNERVKFFRWTI